MKQIGLLISLAFFVFFPDVSSAHHPGILGPINHLGPVQIALAVVAAALDSINPTAFSILILLILSTRHLLGVKVPLIYITGIIFTYLVLGFGFWQIFSNIGLTVIIAVFQAFLAFLLFLSGINEIVPSWGSISNPIKIFLHNIFDTKPTKNITFVFFLGVLVGVAELMTTGAIYVSFLQAISFDPTASILIIATFMAIYIVVFCLPMLLITLKRKSITSFFEDSSGILRKLLGILFIGVALVIAANSIVTIGALTSLQM